MIELPIADVQMLLHALAFMAYAIGLNASIDAGQMLADVLWGKRG